MTAENETILAVERSGDGSAAIFRGGRIVAQKALSKPGCRARNPEWFPNLISLAEEAHTRPREISVLLVGTGPGSFSGIRAAIAALGGISLGTGAPVLGIPSSAVMAYGASKANPGKKIHVIGDARRKRLWLATYDFAHSCGMEISLPPVLVSGDEVEQKILPGSIVISPDMARLRPLFEGIQGANFELAPEEATAKASDLGDLYLLSREAASQNPLPVYLHPAVEPK